MKTNKKISLILAGLLLVFSLAACGADSTNKDETNKNTEQVAPEKDAEPVVDVEEPVVDAEESSDVAVDVEDVDVDSIDAMIDSSEYISKIKLIKKGETATELKVLDNIKGNLSSGDLPAIDSLELNRAYVVFLKKADNTVVLTDEAAGVILLEGDNHELFEKINKKVHNN